jgi:hypothetical protein
MLAVRSETAEANGKVLAVRSETAEANGKAPFDGLRSLSGSTTITTLSPPMDESEARRNGWPRPGKKRAKSAIRSLKD